MESIAPALTGQGYFVKCIATQSVAVFFPGTIQHRDVKRDGVSYEDDYRGNALAATITPGMIDVRFHQGYADPLVKALFDQLLALPEMKWAAGFTVRYQGRILR
ncbi:hypothetical protein [Haloferula sp. BvORR071]|uniref:hypothetical protein n=1 Tax=Haloferula sp. BvORR071 TaxID=1396141 RepID=UPI000A3F0E5F|nr:hypothetical protein [Haloferula sp. BvORR071]